MTIPVVSSIVGAFRRSFVLKAVALGTAALSVAAPISDLTGVFSFVSGCSFGSWRDADGCNSGLAGRIWPAQHLPAAAPLGPDAFVVPIGQSGKEQLYLGHIGSGQVVRLPTLKSRGFASPSFTVDRRSIVYVDSGGDLRVMSAAGDQDHLFMHAPEGCGHIRHASLNFDNPRYLVIECRQSDDGRQSLLVVDTHGHVARTLATGLDRVDDPTVSPDGKTVLCWASPDMARRNNGGAIYSVPFDRSTEPEVLTDSEPGVDADPAFSPDGSTIAYRRRVAGADYDIWLMARDGSQRRPLLIRPGRDEKPAWSPDGKELLVVYQPPSPAKESNRHLLRVDVSTGKVYETGLPESRKLTAVWWHR